MNVAMLLIALSALSVGTQVERFKTLDLSGQVITLEWHVPNVDRYVDRFSRVPPEERVPLFTAPKAPESRACVVDMKELLDVLEAVERHLPEEVQLGYRLTQPIYITPDTEPQRLRRLADTLEDKDKTSRMVRDLRARLTTACVKGK